MLKKRGNKGKGNKGFTLIELIVVISIIGILLMLAVPRLIGYTDQARKTADDQLATLYKNTFMMLLGTGQLTTSPAGTVATITVDVAGNITLTDGVLNKVAADGTSSSADLKLDVQEAYIAKGGVSSGTPSFASQHYSQGITISITSGTSVTVAPKS